METAATILHLTDVHFGTDHRFNMAATATAPDAQRPLLDSVLRDSETLGVTPDLVVVTGDLTSTGQPGEFKQFGTFASSLCSHFKLKHSSVLIVPGNHDVYWGRKADAVSKGEFGSFVSGFYNLPSNDPQLELPIVEFGGVCVLGMDTTTLMRASLSGIGHVGYPQLDMAEKRLKGSKAAVRVLALHHHLLPVSWVEPGLPEEQKSMTLDAPTVLAWAQRNGFSMILHGHQHQSFLATFHLADLPGDSLLVNGGPSAGAKDLPPQERNGYQWIKVEERRLRVTVRERDSGDGYCTAKERVFVRNASGVFAASTLSRSNEEADLDLTLGRLRPIPTAGVGPRNAPTPVATPVASGVMVTRSSIEEVLGEPAEVLGAVYGEVLAPLRRAAGVEEITTLVGDWARMQVDGIQPLAKREDARAIDVLAAYRLGDIRRALDQFRTRPDAMLRACFANFFDPKLLAAYQRKYHDRTKEHIQAALRESIGYLLGPCEIDAKSPTDIRISNVKSAPNANYIIRLTSQRITFGYYRVDGVAFLVPLDMKRAQNPAPLGWVLSEATSPRVANHYKAEFAQVFEEATRVYPS